VGPPCHPATRRPDHQPQDRPVALLHTQRCADRELSEAPRTESLTPGPSASRIVITPGVTPRPPCLTLPKSATYDSPPASSSHRVIMAPLTRCRAEPGRVPGELMVEYYRQRASAGLIISEATSVTPLGVGYPDTPGIWSAEQIQGWRKVTDAVHAAGGKIILQLWHVGRISDPIYLDGQLPVAPSALKPAGHVSLVRPKKDYETPRALETAEIPAIVEAYRKGAENAKEA